MRALSVALVAAVTACGALDQGTPDGSASDSAAADGADAAGQVDVTVGGDASDAASFETSTDAMADAAKDSAMDASACAFGSTGPYGCNNLVEATQIPLTCGTVPTATGGTILDGYYELTSVVYEVDASCPKGASHGGVVEVCGGELLWLDIDQNSSSFDSTMTYTTSGNTITVTPASGSCDGSKTTYEYSATGTTLQIRGGSPTLVFTYTLETDDI